MLVFLDLNSLLLSLFLGMSKKTNGVALPPALQIQHTPGWGKFLITVFSHHLRLWWHLLENYQGYLLSPLTNPAQKLLICTMMKSVKERNCEFFILLFPFPRTLLKFHHWRILQNTWELTCDLLLIVEFRGKKKACRAMIFWGKEFVYFFIAVLGAVTFHSWAL